MSRPPRAPLVAACVGAVVVALIALLAASPKGPREADSPLVGRPAPPLSGATLDGRDFDLARDGRNAWTLVNFFASWCTACVVEHPELVRFAERHRDAGDARVVSVAFEDTPSAVRSFFAERGGGWPVLVSDTSRFALDYGVVKLPESYLVGPTGRVEAKVIGGVNADQLDALIRRLSGRG